MTYLAYSDKKQMTVMLGDLSYVGSLALSSYVTMNVINDEISTTGSGTDTISLGVGHYLISATMGIDCADGSSDLVDFQIEIDGTLIGSKGGRQPLGKVGSDSAECVHTVSSGTSDLKIKITAISGTNTVMQGYSQIYIRRVDI